MTIVFKPVCMFKYFRNLNFFFFKFFKKKKHNFVLRKKFYLCFFLKKHKFLKLSKKNYQTYQFMGLFSTLKFYRLVSLRHTIQFFFQNINFFFINFFFINFFFINFFFINGEKIYFFFNLILSVHTNVKFLINYTVLKFFFAFFLLKKRSFRFIQKRNTILYKRGYRGKLKLHKKYFILFKYKLSNTLLWEFCFLNCSAFILATCNYFRLYQFIPINFFYKNLYFWQKKIFY